ncbi:uncharacterized protein LOC131026578 [Salvia miltiorrhiza]|uniref:uncharacterized protein LOC131026578 n=1 Tax=Salvia miltiorrhiza TaxID=226208 RepID=UPI0025AD906F|nr:uncharacterized protein LOC131026578 [Salvia miltiorrhiza]
MIPFIGGPFLMIGDFNAILGAHERRGRRVPASTPCEDFRAFIDDHDLIQPDTSGPFFTWTDRRRFPAPIESVLDRALFSQDFADIWFSSSSMVLPRLGSDHSPILLRCQDTANPPAGRRFRFLNMWCSHEGFLDQVRASWTLPLDCLCPMDLSSLQENIDEQGYTDDFFDQEVNLQAHIGSFLLRKSEHLRQQSRVSWLSDGDRNTRFFHSMVKWRRSNQNIKQLSIDGVISEDPVVMADHVIHFYEDLFSEPASAPVDRSWISGYIPASVTSAQAATLTAIPSAEDIRLSVFAMDRHSAPGPDGFFTHSYLPHGLNSNLLCLLPKKTDAVLVSDFRPIVLGNFFFKIITKILASRLNEVAAVIVSANQFGFISGRSIQECILMASECVNCMEHSVQGKNMALKVDIRKAFDTLSWDFVEVVLDSFGFPQMFRHWIRVIFQSARISILFNGEQHGFFGCSRGVRQGDPLSPVLFGLAEEVLSHLLLDAADRGFIARMRMSRSLLFPSHLLYADDVLLFCKATRRSCRMIESILQIYASVSGQFCNKAKSTIFFGKGVSVQMRRRLQRDLGFATGSLPFVYLGVPIFAGRASAARLIGIRDCIIAHFPRWQGMQLSMAGRLCLVTSVIQSAAVHSMLIYKWPAKLLYDLDRACRSFIWTGCTTTKAQGGLNVKSFTHISQSFLMRLGWLLLTADSFGFQLFRQRYLDECLRPRSLWFSSTIWLGTRSVIHSLVSDTHCSIGTGSSVLFWLDNWLGYRLVDRIDIPTAVHHSLMHTVSDYFFDDTWHFTLDFFQTFPDIAFDIVSIPIGGVRIAVPGLIPILVSSLRRSGFIGPGWCPICRNASEDIDHLFWDCTVARQIWCSLFTWFRVDIPFVHDIGSLILWAMKDPASKQVDNLWRTGVMSTVWSIWNMRNRVVFDGATVSATAVSVQIKAFILEASHFCLGEMANSVEELLTLHGLGVPGRPRRPLSYVYVYWIPPPAPWCKINIDGSVHGSPLHIHAGGVIRDSSHVLDYFHFSAGRGWAFEAELFALVIALEQTVLHGWSHVWIETDCTYLVDLFRSRSDTVPWRFFSRWRKVLSSIVNFHIIITHIYREGNRVADCLASSVVEEGYWNFAIPEILHLVRDDRR